METKSRWDGDLLERDIFGDFLYKFIVKRHESQTGHDATCCALDGGWGEGKTFFINHWAKDIEGNQHPVIIFDAWKNDHHKDPLLSFIAHINNALSPLISRTPKGPRIARSLKKKAQEVFMQAGKAAIPLGAAVVKNYAKKIVGEEGGEIAKQIIEPSDKLIFDEDIEKFLEKTFEDYAIKNNTIEKVKTDLETLAEKLETIGGFRAPIFIIVDELDRCRPDYALSLLEGIKHIFNAKGIAFVISTNITQLAQSVKALYGQGFDGRNYLRRFFDFDYQLPEGSSTDYIRQIIKNTPVSNPKYVYSGLYLADNWNNIEFTPEETINYLINHFNIDLRSAKQVITKAECFLALQPSHEKTNLTYLIALCCLDIVNDTAIESLIRDPAQRMSTFIEKTGQTSTFKIAHTDLVGKTSNQEKSLSDVLDIYQLSSAKAMKIIHNIDSPNCYEQAIISSTPSSARINPLKKYPQQVKKMTKFTAH
ncbi:MULTISPECIES: P-loop NTPase fold protein [unclassified Acidovorax]|uniref:KAP family P-loop NTPase fold protein n=1 Tax=unclassified Acidovorax TaxID=2684926 RepID=UPI001C457D36|nr:MULTISPECIES: P-loop NTPase fold protein [unclassified Acidovorax]MBV7460432.1 KAP family NTPase [Acidovorax sp. sif0632]MBV7465457.1 KAP family NTPase [Acidovorax sp. sif0613]